MRRISFLLAAIVLAVLSVLAIQGLSQMPGIGIVPIAFAFPVLGLMTSGLMLTFARR